MADESPVNKPRIKPPAFQFYAKDWLSSRTIKSMSLEDRGLYIDLLCVAWDSDEPGTLVLPVFGYNPRTIRSFLLRWPRAFTCTGSESEPNLSPIEAERRLKLDRKEAEIGLKFMNFKLADQWVKLKEISNLKVDAARKRWDAHAMQKQCPAFAFSSSSAYIKKKKEVPRSAKSAETRPPNGDPNQQDFSDVAIRMFSEKYGQRPTWGAGDYTKLAMLLKLKPQLTISEFSRRYAIMLSSDIPYFQQHAGSLMFFASHFDEFIQSNSVKPETREDKMYREAQERYEKLHPDIMEKIRGGPK